MTFELPPLPYPKDALGPHLSAETLDLHHGRHHAAYVEKLNGLVAGTRYAEMPLDEILRRSDGEVFDNAAQHWNHSFFWHCMAPGGGGRPKGRLAEAMERTWGGFDGFVEAFTKEAVSHFGSGWAWLVARDNALEVVSTHDAGNPLIRGATPLLTCDVWEHAYYVDYRNERAAYLEAFWKVVDWDFAAKNLGEPWAVEKAARNV